MTEIVMPRLSDTMEEGTILHWLCADGDHVERGQELVEIETDKAAMTYESDVAGVLQILAAEGDTLPVGAVIAQVGAAAPDGAADGAAAARGAPDGPSAAVGDGRSATAPASAAAGAAAPAAEQQAPGASGHGEGSGERVRASPLARRVAREQGIDLSTLRGSGPGGRIVRADVSAGAGAAATAPPPTATVEGVATAKGETTVVELTRTQQTIARRMAEAKATIPEFSVQADVDMEECVSLRSELKRVAPRGEGAPTYNDMVVKACALALREHPRANASYRDGALHLHGRINVGVAVAAPDALVVPTVFDADEKSLGEIARETRTLAERVRAGTVTPPELGGGTFTVSNLGMYGVASFTPIINPPQAGILSVGALAPRAVVREGELVARATMTLTLVSDHRVLYGADAAALLARVRELLQTPAALTL